MTPAQDATALADEVLRIQTLIANGRPNSAISACHELQKSLRATSQTPDAVREAQVYTAELYLNGKYTWCIVKALPRVENVIQEFGYGPDAYRTAQDRLSEIKSALSTPSASAGPQAEAGTFQQRVDPWLMECFGLEIARDILERNHRFLEEALETVQANGCTVSEAHQLVDYVFGRDQGDINQEVGGVMVTLAALCLASGVDMHAAAETELARVWTKVEKIRAKHFAKPKFSPLPGYAHPQPQQADGRAVIEAARLRKALESCRTAYCGYAITKPDEQYPTVLANFWREIQRIDGVARAALQQSPATDNAPATKKDR